ncbi:RCC1/BLIP-II [Lichtheimia hyalospora FSU 10163]|nr:RCC1/BLIP-II [Lichtheimia hyalospora FSU 10163]
MSCLYSFGFNAFGQVDPDSNQKVVATHHNISNVLLTTWESAVISTDTGELQWWGYQPIHDTPSPSRSLTDWGDRCIKRMFGDMSLFLGAVDDQGDVWYRLLSSTYHIQLLASKAQDAVYCSAYEAVYILTVDGDVDHYKIQKQDDKMTFKLINRLTTLPRVYSLAASSTHVLFYTSGMDPIYSLGSNRFSQLGFDTSTIQALETPTPIEYFGGLGMMDPDHQGMVACGLFHSAVVLGGDLYTFGWNKDGRLGWHDNDDNDDDVISPAVFLDADGEPIQEDINVVRVTCGAAHTLAMDDHGRVWSCGSNKYGQLGRKTSWQHHEIDNEGNNDHDTAFRQVTILPPQSYAKNCFTGRWSSYILM